jgi:multisubunit Na+/H+ antiporter MnhB subunit
MSDYTPPPIPSGSSQISDLQKPNEILALLALIIGGVALAMAIVPGLSFIAFLPGISAVVLGILTLALKKPGKTKGIVGLSLGASSVVVGLIVSTIFLGSSLNGTDKASPIATETTDTSDSSFIDESQTLTEPNSNAGDQVTYDVAVPNGFEDGGTGVAYRFIEEDCQIWDYCVIVELFAYTDCPQGVDVEGNEIDYDTDTIYDATYESTGAMYAGDNAVVELGILNPRANGVQLTDIICYY